MNELLTPRQVAERLSVSPRTVYLWIEQGRLPVVRFSERVTRVPAEAVEALVEAAYVPPTRRLRELLRVHRDEILAIALRRSVENVRVFGSVARGDAGATSDIDLLVDLAAHASLMDLSGFAGEVEELLGVRIDVVVERSIKAEIRDRALREALPL